MDIIAKIREQSREQWVELVRGYIDDVRIWVDDNGLKASAVALVAGMVFILFLKLFITLMAIGALVGFFIWSVAIPEGQSEASSSSSSDEDDVKKDQTH
jgi:hypothetical protein